MKPLTQKVDELLQSVKQSSSRALARGEIDKLSHDKIYHLSEQILAIAAQETPGGTTETAAPSVLTHK